MVRPLEEPLRTWNTRRGGGSVDEEGGRLRRPGPARRNAEARRVRWWPGAGACWWPARGDASVPPPHRTAPAPTRWARALQKPLPLAGNTFPRRRVASQTKPIQECHPEQSEGSLAGPRSFALLRMTRLLLRMTRLNRLRLTRNSSSVKWIGACRRPVC